MAHIVLGQGETLTKEQAIAIQEQRIIDSNNQYIKILKHSLKTIKELDSKDRLELAFGIWVIVECMKGSIKGWDAWLNLRSMQLLTEKDLKKIFPVLKEVTLKWIQLDVEITQAKTDELLAKIKERKKKIIKKAKKPKKPSKNIYVA